MLFYKLLTAKFCFALVLTFAIVTSQSGVYYPSEAREKGLSKTAIGLISGVQEASALICGLSIPLLSRPSILTRLFSLTFVTFSFASVIFGLLTFIDHLWIYVGANIPVQILFGAGASGMSGSFHDVIKALKKPPL